MRPAARALAPRPTRHYGGSLRGSGRVLGFGEDAQMAAPPDAKLQARRPVEVQPPGRTLRPLPLHVTPAGQSTPASRAQGPGAPRREPGDSAAAGGEAAGALPPPKLPRRPGERALASRKLEPRQTRLHLGGKEPARASALEPAYRTLCPRPGGSDDGPARVALQEFRAPAPPRAFGSCRTFSGLAPHLSAPPPRGTTANSIWDFPE
ncbi:hypothetical protein AB1E18_006455 [Capra hircus]